MACRMVSVVVPVYNGEKYIDKCVNSLIHQTYKPIEVIIVDDGSTDNSYEICKQYSAKYKYIKIISKKNEGVTIARLTGIKAAEGDYISFVDADDWIPEDYIENMIMEMGDADIIMAGISLILSDESNRVIKEKNNIQSGVYEKERLVSLFGKMLCYKMPFKAGILPYACNKIYKKKMLTPLMENVDKKINDGEDVAIVFPYLINSSKVVLSDYCGYQYLIHNDSACHQKHPDAYSNASRLYIWLYEAFKTSKYNDILMPQLRNYLLRMIWKRDPGVYIETNEFVFPFGKIKRGSNIIIYGAGDVGKAYYIQVKQSDYCNIVAWADKNVKYSEWMKCNLISPEEIIEKEFDYIVVAIRSEYVCNQVFKYLCSIGVDAQKIILCDAGVEKNESDK